MIKLPILESASVSVPCCTADPERPGCLIAHGIPDFPQGEVPVITSALSGGFFRTYLEQASEGNRPVCLLLTPLCHIFRIPCPDGIGQPISQEELCEMRKLADWQYAPQLMCHYGYSRKEHWMILYDDDNTLQQKAAIAEELNYAYLAASEELIEKLRLPD